MDNVAFFLLLRPREQQKPHARIRVVRVRAHDDTNLIDRKNKNVLLVILLTVSCINNSLGSFIVPEISVGPVAMQMLRDICCF